MVRWGSAVYGRERAAWVERRFRWVGGRRFGVGVSRVLAGRYALGDAVGRGAVGVVYRGVDRESRRVVAVKVVDDGLVRGLGSAATVVREVWGLAELRHPGLAEIRDVGNDPKCGVCVVSEFVEGERVDSLAEGALHPDAVLEVAEGLLAVLAEGHARGMTHGDLKPSDVLVVRQGGRLRVKVTDYGLVRVLSGTGTRFTQSGEMIGGAAWTPPEEAERGADGAAWNPVGEVAPGGPEGDVYSVGCLLYGLLTGRAPFRGDVQGVLHQQVHRTAEPPSHAVPDLSPHWDALLARAMAKRPQDRFPDAAAMRDALEPLRAAAPHRPAAATPPPPPATRDTPAKRRRSRALWLVPVAGVAAASAVAYVLTASPFGPPASGGPSSPAVALPVSPAAGSSVVLAHMTAVGDGEDVKAVRLAVDAYNATGPDTRIELRVYEPSAEGIEAVTRRVLDEGAVGVIGPGTSSDAEAVVPVLEESGIPSIAYGTTVADLGDRGFAYWHRLVAGDDAQGDAVEVFLRTGLKARRVAVVHDGTEDGRPLAERVRQGVEGHGGAAKAFAYSLSDTGYGGVIDAVRDFKADAVFVAGHHPGAGRLLKALRAKGMKVPFVGGDGVFGQALIDTAERDAEGAYVSCACLVDPEGTSSPPAGEFVEAYRSSYGLPPSAAYTAEAYDAATLFVRAISEGASTPEDVNTRLAATDLSGVSGPLGFTPDGEPRDPAVHLYRVDQGAFTPLGPAPEARP
ncbi:hypothetical protein GCM10022221_38860 [Actinocorallia aurea]